MAKLIDIFFKLVVLIIAAFVWLEVVGIATSLANMPNDLTGFAGVIIVVVATFIVLELALYLRRMK